MPSHGPPRHNLPVDSSRLQLFGRQKDVGTIRRYLSPANPGWTIAIEGLGGIGKTALALHVGWQLVEAYRTLSPAERFHDIVWVTFNRRARALRAQVDQPAQQMPPSTAVFRAIADVLERPKILNSPPNQQYNAVMRALKRRKEKRRMLLMIDSIDSVDDQLIRDLLQHLPAPHKAIVTSRSTTDHGNAVPLDELDDDAVRAIVTRECARNGLALSPTRIAELADAAEGHPLVACLLVGLARDHSVDHALQVLRAQNSVLLRSIFDHDISSLYKNDRQAYYVLLALALFDVRTGARMSILAPVVGLDVDACQRAVDVLVGRNLVTRYLLPHSNLPYYRLLRFTHRHVLDRARASVNWYTSTYDRLVKQYLAFTQARGGVNGLAWHTGYAEVHTEWPSLLGVFRWCEANGRYDDLQAFWLEDRVQHVTHVRGLWADRLHWYEKLIANARRRHNGALAIKASVEKARTLACMRHEAAPDEAYKELKTAWRRCKHVHVDVRTRAELAIILAAVHVRQNNPARAQWWLDVQKALCADPAMPRANGARLSVDALNLRAIMDFKKLVREGADEWFQDAVRKSIEADYPRGHAYARLLRGKMLIEGDLDFAQQVLEGVLADARTHHDPRLIACCERALEQAEELRRQSAPSSRADS